MKPGYLLFLLSVATNHSFAHSNLKHYIFNKHPRSPQEQTLPQYPGGTLAFSKFIKTNLKYPAIAQLIGINGKVNIYFIIDRNGKVTDVQPTNCIGAGCEAEAVAVVKRSQKWKPGTMYGAKTETCFTIPINFQTAKTSVNFKDLNKSAYGFIFEIKGKRYTIGEAQNILGQKLPSDKIEIADPFYNSDNNPKFKLPEKKDIYLLRIKS